MKVLIKKSQQSREMKNFVNIKFLRVRFFSKRLKPHFTLLKYFNGKKVCSQIYINLELYDKITYGPLLLKELCLLPFHCIPAESLAIKANN